MIITRLSDSCFLIKDRVKQPEATIILGHPGKKIQSIEPDLVLVGLAEKMEGVSEEKTFLINYPGEYDIKNILVKGIQDDGHIIYILDLNGEKLAYLSGLGQAALDDRQIEQLGDIHVLVISIGGQIGAKFAARLISRIEPRSVVPMNYQPEELKQFLKIMGVEQVKPEDSINLQADSLPKEGLVVKVLNQT